MNFTSNQGHRDTPHTLTLSAASDNFNKVSLETWQNRAVREGLQ